ncbi:Ppx/GppA phosphatase family protein [Polycladidibacter stylochi]|uniref:Ppx/GppA phosphatase family protein n=1 Tax=Polycladidibacter stylochi TaxID=1807766 RepID=UPI000A4CB08D|nr:Ppx/GppA phosphatase family protein [Pseudovibrio stylochi]
MKKKADRSSSSGTNAPGGKSRRKSRRNRRPRKSEVQAASANGKPASHSRTQATEGGDGGSTLPEGVKRQKRTGRNKPNRAERRALAMQARQLPIVKVEEDAVRIETLAENTPTENDKSRPEKAFKPARRGSATNTANESHQREFNGRYKCEPRAASWRSRTADDHKGRFAQKGYASRPPYIHEDEENQKLYAALDLGTNNCRLLIARPENRGFRVIDAYSKIVRLGEGLGNTGRLSEEAMERAVEALKVCHHKLMERGVERMRLIATEACRAAENGVEFTERAQREAHLPLEIVSQETEARLAVAGCVSLVDPKADGVLLFDIGGGSSEIVWLDLRNRQGARGFALTRFIRTWTSLPLGVVNLAERHGGVQVTPQSFEAMVADVTEKLHAFPMAENLSRAIANGNVHMLGTSGTVTTLAGVHLGLRRYDRRRVDGAWLEKTEVSAMIQQLLAMSYHERVDNPCIGQDRADLVLAGCAILEAIRRRWPCARLRVADRGLREGILMEMMAKDKVWRHTRRHFSPPKHNNPSQMTMKKS